MTPIEFQVILSTFSFKQNRKNKPPRVQGRTLKNVFTETGSSWSEFHVTPKTRKQVEVYLRCKMEKYYKGEVYKRQK